MTRDVPAPTPKLGPEPTLLSRKEVDALYDTLAIVQQALKDLDVEFIVTGGSLLGAIRQHSILFCDDDVDIAIIEDPSPSGAEATAYEKVRQNLPNMLPNDYQYQVEPWPGGDRVRPRKMNNIFVDIFSLRRYDSEEELKTVIGRKQNGHAQLDSYVDGILQTIHTAAFSQGESTPLYPCWQFATRKAIEMWPKEVYREAELFPLSSVNMGPIVNLSGPRAPVLLLKRAFGIDCFDVYYQSYSHQTNGKGKIAIKDQSEVNSALPPFVGMGGTWESQTKQPLEAHHYIPMQPTQKAKRRFTSHNQSTFFDYLQAQTAWEQQQLGLGQYRINIPAKNGKVVTKTIYMDGVFDLFHIGHLKAIQECAKLGNRIIIGVTGDSDATGYKRKPIMDQEERSSIVAALKIVDQVVCPCPLVVTEAFMNKHKIDLVVHGFVNEADAQRQSEFFDIPIKLGKFQQIPYTTGVSTTDRICILSKDSTKPTKPQWFGSCIAMATNKSASIPFNPFPLDIRIVMEPHLRKALKRRADSLEAIRTATGPAVFDEVLSDFQCLPVFREGAFCYDIKQHDLRGKLLQCRERGDSDIDLSRLHESHISKDVLFQSVMKSHEIFQHSFDEFVRVVCVPKMAELCDKNETIFYYQAFPCIRIVQPGEFSIGPHADVSYGHHPCSINCYVLLTDISEANSASILFLESAPNRQDWHPILGKYGTVHYFTGGLSTHWTTDNHTETTRASLDFRIIPGSYYDSISCGGSIRGGKRDVYREKDGYYSSCRKSKEHESWFRDGPVLSPIGDPRFGYPWTGSKKDN